MQLNVPISVRSTPNKGSCFSLTLPLAKATNESVTLKSDKKTQFAKLNVLCVDDIQQNLDAMQILLKKWQIENSCCQNLADSITLATDLKPNVLLIDYNLGNQLTGLEVISTLRNLLGEHTPAAIITANQDETLVEACKSNNIGYLSKPIKPAKLRALLNSYIAHL